ncbi:uncharacterized protein C1orf167 [Cavia porcellus]|uniref:uncharacterized protein C1orf167 n=1 Tax=Cavia porcellus TaxID=10141 RepID=UPI002FDF9CE2
MVNRLLDRERPRHGASGQPLPGAGNQLWFDQLWSVPSRQLLSRCLRAWIRVTRRQRAVAVAVALSRRQLLREGFRALRWTLWLREAWLEVARRRHEKALLAQTFREWRCLVVQQTQGRPYVQPASRPCASWGGKDQVPRWGGEAAGHGTPRSRGRRLREEEGAWPPPLKPRQRPDGGDQELQQLAAFLLCQKKDLAGKGPLGEVTPRTQRTDVAPRAPQPRRDWLRRCFGAWHQVAQRKAQCQDHLADRCRRTLRMCLGQWVRMKQLRASDGAKVTQLSLCLQKAGYRALRSSAHGLETVVATMSLQGACRRLALQRVLLLWRMRLSQHQRANCFFQGTREQTLRRVLGCWHLRVWSVDTPSTSHAATSAPEPLDDGIPGASAWPGCSARWCSLEKDPGAPHLPGTPPVSDPWAAERQQQDQRLLPWRRAWGSARRCHSLQRRILLTWSHWTATQGTWRELAAHQAWDRSCRAALGLWRRRLAQQQEAARWAQERSRSRARDALCHWHTCWQRQQLLHEKYRSWVHGRLQGLRRAAFRDWRQGVVRRRHLRRSLLAWAQGHVQQATITQLWQAGLGYLLWTHWAQWQTALLRVQGDQGTQAQGADLRHWPRLASRGRRLLLTDAPALWMQAHSCWTQAAGPTRLEPKHSCSGHRLPREAAGACSARECHLCPGFQLWPGHSSWAPTAPGRLCVSEIKAPQSEGPSSRLGRKYLQRWHLEILLRRFQVSQRARCLRATWQHWAGAPGAEQLSQSLLRQWHLGRAWRVWRRRVLQLHVARRLQKREDSWVISQAFERWRQHLAARSLRRGGTRQGPQEQAGCCPCPWLWSTWAGQGSSSSRDLFPWLRSRTEPREAT